MKKINFYEYGREEIYVTIYFNEKDHNTLNRILEKFDGFEYEIIKEDE